MPDHFMSPVARVDLDADHTMRGKTNGLFGFKFLVVHGYVKSVGVQAVAKIYRIDNPAKFNFQ